MSLHEAVQRCHWYPYEPGVGDQVALRRPPQVGVRRGADVVAGADTGQGCIKLTILSLRGTSGERTEERGNQSERKWKRGRNHGA